MSYFVAYLTSRPVIILGFKATSSPIVSSTSSSGILISSTRVTIPHVVVYVDSNNDYHLASPLLNLLELVIECSKNSFLQDSEEDHA
ncbi:hypothetical protein Scep_012523 [Stephania cephalantha]|uniref:Uncharacterized protein n=1 Tax=Stephania cephalantha TaxID=152367 RepID=A0AAP0JG42_9MAGN